MEASPRIRRRVHVTNALLLVVLAVACGGRTPADETTPNDAGVSACARYATPGEACRAEPECRWVVTTCRDYLGHGYYDSAIHCTSKADCRPEQTCTTLEIRDCRREGCIDAKPTIDVCWPPPATPLPDPPEW